MTQNDGKYHNKKENKKRATFYCPYCGGRFRSKLELSLHMISCKKA